MIWFDIKQLEKNLKTDAVSEKETFTYLFVLLLISTIFSYVNGQKTPLQLSNWIELTLDVVLTVLTLKTTYDINTKGDNRDYVKRFMALTTVIMIRLIVFAVPGALVGLTIIKILENTKLVTVSSLNNLFDLAMTFGLGVAYYFMLTQSFKRINSTINLAATD
ncbi:MAG: hypothetical protein J0L67_00110 [Cytophagales bacterium]|nr:hypothetical protein [Cytophagales bacterium]